MTATAGNRIRFFYGWYLPIAGSALGMVCGVYLNYGFGVYLPAIIEETGWSRAAASGVYGILGAEIGLFAPVYGYLIERFGPRKLLFSGSIIGGIGLYLLSTTDSLLMFYVYFSLTGLGFTSFTFAPIAAVVSWFNQWRALSIGIITAGFSLGGMLIPALQWSVLSYGWRTALLIGACIAFVVCVPLSLVFRDRPGPYGYGVDGVADTETTDPSTTNEESEKFTAKSLRELKTRRYVFLALLYLVILVGFAGMLPHLLVHYGDMGLGAALGAYAFTLYGVSSLVGRVGGGLIADRFDKRRVIALGCAMTGLGLLGTAYTSEFWQVVVFFVLLLAVGFAITVPSAVPALIGDIYGSRRFPMMYSLVLMPGTTMVLVAPAVFGWVADTTGTYHLALVVAAFLALAGIPLALALPKGPVPAAGQDVFSAGDKNA